MLKPCLPFQLADSADGSNSGMDYHMEIINKDDKLRVLKFLRRFFFRDEPLNQSIQLIPEGEDSTCEELEDYCSKASFENNLSLMAVSASGTIVGVALNGKAATFYSLSHSSLSCKISASESLDRSCVLCDLSDQRTLGRMLRSGYQLIINVYWYIYIYMCVWETNVCVFRGCAGAKIVR